MFDEIRERIHEIQEPVLTGLQRSAVKHAALSGGLLVAQELDIALHPNQSLFSAVAKGSPTDKLADVAMIASIVRPAFGAVSKALKQRSETNKALDDMGEIIDSGQNVVLGFDHGEDVVAFAASAVAINNQLKARGHIFRTGFVGSKMLDFLELDANFLGDFKDFAVQKLEGIGVTPDTKGRVAARAILSKIFDRQYLTIPGTASTGELRKAHKIGIRHYNNHVLSELKGDLSRRSIRKKPPMVAAIALPGAINQTKESGDKKTETVGRINATIGDAIAEALTLPVVAKLNTQPAFILMGSDFRCFNSVESANFFGEEHIRLLAEADPSKAYRYDKHGELF